MPWYDPYTKKYLPDAPTVTGIDMGTPTPTTPLPAYDPSMYASWTSPAEIADKKARAAEEREIAKLQRASQPRRRRSTKRRVRRGRKVKTKTRGLTRARRRRALTTKALRSRMFAP